MRVAVRPAARSSDGYSAARTIGLAASLIAGAVCARGLAPVWAFLPLWVAQVEMMCRLFDHGFFGATKAAEPAEGEMRAYTWEEVAARNGSDAGWVAIDGIVYDVTDFIERHPGGKEMILLALGRDATDLFKSYHPFSDKPWKILKNRKVGTLATYEHPSYKKDSGFYKDAAIAVKQYFEKTGLDRKGPLVMFLRMAPAYVVFAVCFYITFIKRDVALSIRYISAVLLGAAQGMPLTGWMHDASHASIGSNEKWWWSVGRFALDVVSGSSMLSWRNQHVIGHHVYTNVMGADPDLPVKLDSDARRLVDEQKWHKFYQWQHIYLLPLYGILGLKSRIQDFTEVFSQRKNGPIRVNPISTEDYLRMVAGKAIWAFYRIVVPLTLARTLSHTQFWSLFMVVEWMTGYWLAFNFQVSHVSAECEFLYSDTGKRNEGKCPNDIADEWAVKQVTTTLDYGHNSWWAAYLSGALNYQTVHHLFPTVSQFHYPAITPIVMEVARKYGIKFNVKKTFTQALGAHVEHLREMGRNGIGAELKME